jgi:hypothetical protein
MRSTLMAISRGRPPPAMIAVRGAKHAQAHEIHLI